jgi:Arc/MetJ-type ribon-helix-helix transcriptional regulator
VAAIRGKPKKQIGYKIPPDLMRKIEGLISGGEFSSQSDIITAALRSFFDKREFEEMVDIKVMDFLRSEKGLELLGELKHD